MLNIPPSEFKYSHLHKQGRIYGLVTMLLTAIIIASIIWKIESVRLEKQHAEITDIANKTITLLHKNITQKLSFAYPFAAIIRNEGEIHNFVSIAEELVAFDPLISEIALAPDGIVTQVAPLLANEKAIGFNVLSDPKQKAEALVAFKTQKMILTGVIDLVQGGQGLIGRLPVFVEEDDLFWGFVLVIIKYPDILDTTDLKHLKDKGYAFTIAHVHPTTKAEKTIASSQNVKLNNPVETTIEFPNATWILRISPIDGWTDYGLLILEISLGILIILLLGYMIKQYMEIYYYRHFLEKEIEQRTLEISQTKNQLHTLLNTIPDLIWLKNIEGVYLLCNPMFERFFGAKEEHIVGKTDYDFIDKELADFFRKNDRSVMETNKLNINEEWLTFDDNGYHGLFETLKIPFYNDDDQLVGVLGVARDITQRHNAEKSLLQTEKLLEEMSQLAHVGGWEFNVKTGEGAWTQEIARIHDLDPNAPTSAEIGLSVYHGKWLDEIQNAMDTAIHKGIAYNLKLQMITALGNTKWVHTIGTPVINHGEVTHIRGSMQDITSQKIAQEKIEWLAHFDILTGLPNRALLNEKVKSAINLASRTHAPFAVLFLDLDNFKNINDTLGHDVGDLLLIEVSKRMKAMMRESDILSRQGGDEFVILLPNATPDNAAHVAEKILNIVSQACQLKTRELTVTASIGIALYPMDGENFNQLLQSADSAMYHAKNDGRNCYRFFTPEIQAQASRHLEIENALRHAIKRNEFELHYQPQVSISTKQFIGAEALLRWKHPVLGMVSPAEFIPIAEDTGQIIVIGEWVIRTALTQLKTWLDGGMEPFIMSVNLSAVQFRHPKLLSSILGILEEIQLSAEYLELELTEGAMMENPLEAIALMNSLHQHGIQMSIDDFGTGYSSLNYLKKFNVYKLKIDQSFIRDVPHDTEDKTIVKTIINMAHDLNMLTIAEGVETEEQLEFLHKNGCDELQGYYISRPIPAEEFKAFVVQFYKS